MNETVRIEGKQIALRPITLEDTPLIVRWRSDPRVYGTLFRQEPITEERHRQWLREMVLSGKCDQFIIVDKAQNRPVGTVFLKEIDREHLRAEYAIFIGEETARGRGIGSEAAVDDGLRLPAAWPESNLSVCVCLQCPGNRQLPQRRFPGRRPASGKLSL